jgi:hypothetical protein
MDNFKIEITPEKVDIKEELPAQKLAVVTTNKNIPFSIAR